MVSRDLDLASRAITKRMLFEVAVTISPAHHHQTRINIKYDYTQSYKWLNESIGTTRTAS
jgi:hypothetical protein